jgi:LuxR family maltose regulon positive regulatory protein
MAEAVGNVTELHLRASVWYEDYGLEIEAFHHAAAANDVERAERLIEGKSVPRYSSSWQGPLLSFQAREKQNDK